MGRERGGNRGQEDRAMTETDKIVAAINRLAQSIERLADAYLDVNLPEDEAEDRPTQSLSDRG